MASDKHIMVGWLADWLRHSMAPASLQSLYIVSLPPD